jgi:hypothetical protein
MDYLVEEILRQLKIVEVASLYPHEETIPSNLLKLKEAMLNIGQLVDPLIVDGKNNVVLDGNHRLKVLTIIKIPHAVAQVVDYARPDIKVGTWFPVSENLTLETLEASGFKCEEVDFAVGLKALENKKAPFMLVKKIEKIRKCFLINPSDYSLDEMIEEQRTIINKLNDVYFHYVADSDVNDLIEDGKAVLYRKIYSKEEIIARALSKKPFPPKSTRHIIPNRIIRLNMRLGWLHEGESEARAYLERMLRERVYNGNVRRYSEPVIVIY